MTRRLVFGLVLAALCAVTTAGHAGTWPERAIRIVVGFPPGPTDIVTRPLAEALSKALGQPVIIENHPGANGSIAAEQVMKAAPDGYTLLVGTSGTHVTAVHLFKNLRYDPVTDFAPIVAMVEPATCLVVTRDLPVTSVPELIAYARANPNKLSYASPGVGSTFHLLGELLKQTAGIEMVHIAYKGSDPALTDLIAGHVPVALAALSSAMPHVEAGRARLLAVLEPARFARVPEVPSITEFVPAFRKPPTWFGLFAPRDTPEAVIARLNAEIVTILNTPEMRRLMADNSYAVIGGPPSRLNALVVDGIARFGDIIHAAGIEPQ